MITRNEILKGRELPKILEPYLDDLLNRLNELRAIWGKPMVITSGYRPPEYNKEIGGAKNSAHIYAMAADIWDPNKELAEFLSKDEKLLEELGFWMEDPKYTRNWVHLQTRPAKNRIFKP